jgi:hypothetical protein
MPLKVPSGRAEFDGFDGYYAASIAPYLAEKEKERAAAVTNVLILGGATAALSLAFAFFGPFGDANFHAAAFLGFGGAALAMWLLNRARADITHGLLYRIAGQLGFAYTGKLDRPAYYDDFRRLKLLPNHNREEWEDEVSGAYEGNNFVLCEAHLKMKSSGKNSSVRTVFHGQLLIIDYPKRFLGSTVLLRDAGMLNALGKPGKYYSRVGLASPEFEQAFEAWSTDQVEARDLLDPIVLERFQELERLCGGKKLRAAFNGGRILIAIETGDRLNIGTMFAPLHGAERVETILAEFDAVFDLIDIVLKRLDGRIDGAFSVAHVKAAERT